MFSPVEPTITNIQPVQDVELAPLGSFDISFNAPTGGSAYYKILLPLEVNNNNLGTPMVEETTGFYKATWIAPEGFIASNLQIEVIYIDESGAQLKEMAIGRLSVRGEIEDVPVNSVILGDEAFDMDYLNNNANTQKKLVNWVNSGRMVYIKINQNTMVDSNGNKVGTDILPNRLIHHDLFGVIRIFER